MRVMTVHAMPAATTIASTAPVTTPMTPLAKTDQIRFQIGARRYSCVLVVCTRTGRRCSAVRLPRDGSTVALAGLRHPAATSDRMASPAIQAEAVVSSLTDTQDEMLTTPPPAVRAPRAIHRAWALPLTVVAFVATTALLLASVLSADLVATNGQGVDAPFALVPADAQPVEPRISFDAVERYPANGEVLFVTIRQPEVTLLDHFIGRDQLEVQPLSYEQRYGVQTPSQQQTFNAQMMRTAKETAEYVALSYLGYPAKLVLGAVIVNNLVCLEWNEAGTKCVKFPPSDGLLDPGDKLLKVDGVPLEVLDDLDPILAKHKPGDTVGIELDRPGEGTKTGEVELIASPTDPTRTIIGFQPFDTSTADIPFDVGIDSGEIGGPSAGLAFTLTLLDELTPGELTGGNKIAVTGTISINGDVGAIGGLGSKTSAVKQMGASVFIVPTSQGEDDIAKARAIAGDDLRIIPVANVQEALEALAAIGGNGLELGKPGADFDPAS